MRKYLCEFLGTCVLVFFGCGVAVLSNGDLLATALAFGLAIVAVYYTISHISGCHVNPAVSFAMWVDKRVSTKDFIAYVIAQILGAIAAAGLLFLIFRATTVAPTLELGANAYGNLSISGITMLGALILEIILAFVFVLAVLGITREGKNTKIAGIVIGLSLVLVFLLGFHLTGTSVNPARSIAPSLFLGGQHLEQVWVFIVGPLVGAAFAALAIFFIDLDDNAVVIKEKIKEEKEVKVTKVAKEKKEETTPVKKPKPRKAKSAKKLA